MWINFYDTKNLYRVPIPKTVGLIIQDGDAWIIDKNPGRFTLNESQWLSFARRWYEGLDDNHNPFVKEQSMMLGGYSLLILELTGVWHANPHVLKTNFQDMSDTL